MATDHITVRLPADLGAQLREQAKRSGRSLAFVVAARLGYWSQIESALRQESAAKDRKPQKVAPQRVVVMDSSSGCPSCGGLNGMHQRGCSQQR